jgi:dTDP-4-dehydrorhamnose 3,5-epimerase
VIFETVGIDGAALVRSEPHTDERGSFARLRCTREFLEAGLPSEFVQTNLSINHAKGTLRGLHFQLPPSREGKLIRCMRGTIYDVIVDLRPGSTTYLVHHAEELSEGSGTALYAPHGCAHGFVTLTPDCHVLYEMTDYYEPELARGVRWDDPAFGIDWPVANPSGSERDLTYPDFDIELVQSFRDLT